MKFQSATRLKPLLQALAFCLAAAVALVIASIAARHFEEWSEQLVIGVVGVLLTVILTALFLHWNRKGFHDIGLAPDRYTLARFLVGLAVGFTLVALHVTIVAGAGHVRWIRNDNINAQELGAAILGYGLLALREEIAFRGYALRILLPAYGAIVAQLIVMAVFIAEHRLGGATWSNAIFGAGLGALVFSMAALATRGIALPLGLHAAWNLGDWIRGGKGEHGVWIMQVEDGRSAQISVIVMGSYVSLMLLTFAGFLVLYRRNQMTRENGHQSI